MARTVCVGKHIFFSSCVVKWGSAQVSGACLALQHNLRLGGAAVVTVYRKYKWTNCSIILSQIPLSII